MLDKKVIEDSLRYHEWNLARLINERSEMLDKIKVGKASKVDLDRIENAIKQVKEIVHNYKTLGRAYK